MILIPFLIFALLGFARHWSGILLAHTLSPDEIAALNRGLAVAMIVAASVVVDGFVRYFYWHRYWRRRRRRETPALIRDLLTIAIVLLGLSLALWWIEGLSFTGLVTASGATAIILGIALQTVIQDLFSGLSINLEGSYRLGDWLTIYGDHMPDPAYGQVSAITWRSTYLTMRDGCSLMVPNHTVTANAVVNHSRNAAPKRLHVDIPLDSRAPSAHVVDLLLGEALKAVRDNRLSSLPAPMVMIDHVGTDCTHYRVYFFADPAVIGPEIARSVMYCAMMDVIQHHGLPLAVTQVEMTQAPALNLQTGTDQIRNALHRASLFRGSLNHQQYTELSGRCVVREFEPQDMLMHQGDTTASMFILLSGAARVMVAGADGSEQEVAMLAMGDVAGEMSLMTGAPRTATVSAASRLRALEIDKDAIAPLLQESPELFQRFSENLARRQQQLQALANRPGSRDNGARDILTRIRAFFGAD